MGGFLRLKSWRQTHLHVFIDTHELVAVRLPGHPRIAPVGVTTPVPAADARVELLRSAPACPIGLIDDVGHVVEPVLDDRRAYPLVG